MNRNNTEYSIYGLNNAISLLSSTKYLINNISIMKGSVSESNPLIQEYISSKKNMLNF